MITKAIYPGTFDPFTNGHLDLVIRSGKIFDHVILAIAENSQKNTLFNFVERIKLAQEVTKNLKNVSVLGFTDLLINFAKQQKANILIRGLRTFSDFEYEMQLFKLNNKLNSEIECVFLMFSKNLSYLSSSLVKEIAFYGGNLNLFLPNIVAAELKKKYAFN